MYFIEKRQRALQFAKTSLDLILSLYEVAGISSLEMESTRVKKNEVKGAFEKKIYCEYIELEENNPKLDHYLNQPEKYPQG